MFHSAPRPADVGAEHIPMKKDVKREWFPVASRGRDHSILILDTVGVGIRDGALKETYGIDYRLNRYRQFNGKRSIGLDDYQNLVSILEKASEENPGMFYDIGTRLEHIVNTFIPLTDAYRNRDWSSATNKELSATIAKLLGNFVQLWAGGGIYLLYFYFNDIFVERFVAELKVKMGDDFERILPLIMFPEKPTMANEEKAALLRIAEEARKAGRISEQAVQEHWERYVFLKKYFFWGDGYTLDEMRARVAEAVQDNAHEAQHPVLSIDDFDLTDKERLIVLSMRKVSYVMNHGDELGNYSIYHTQSLYEEAARRLGLAHNELVSMTIRELAESLEGGVSVVPQEDLAERLRAHAIIYTNGEPTILIREELERYRRENTEHIDTSVHEVKGAVANRGGVIRGTIRILWQDVDVSNFKKGEILVTPMTNPAFVPAMQRAAAIVTDDGGLLCHAAIISRELGVPCIIGTKIATKVFKDGDLVEVDAEKGIVRKI